MRVFPSYLFQFSEVNADIERRVLSGGAAISGAEEMIQTDGGGRFFAEFGDPYLDDADVALAWRSISATMGGGTVPVIVPVTDIRHQFGQEIRVPDTVGWWNETEYPANGGASLGADAALRAIELQVAIDYLPGPLKPGMWLSIDHDTLRHRAYQIAEITAQDHDSATIRLSHPLREATDTGTAIEFIDPRCVCRIDGAMQSPTSFGFASSKVRFVEHFGSAYA